MSNAYSDQATIEAFLARSLTSSEVTLLPLIQATVYSWINVQTETVFGVIETETRYYDGGTNIIDIDPCTSVTAVSYVDSQENIIYTYTADEEYEARPRNDDSKRWIERRSFRFQPFEDIYGCFPVGVANIAVTATFGNSSVPDDIKYLATYLAGKLLSPSVVGNLEAESIEGYSRKFKEWSALDNVAQMALEAYTRNDIFI